MSPDVPLPVGADVEPVLEHTEPPACAASVNPDVPPPVEAEVESVLGHAAPPAPEAAVSPELPLPVDTVFEPILDHAAPPAPEAAMSPDVPLPVGAEAEPMLGRAEPPEAAANAYTAQNDYGDATTKSSEAIQLDPKFPVAYENRNLIKSKTGAGSIGVTIRRLTDGVANALNVKPACGALVVDIDENGTAKAAGIEPRDVIIKVDGRDVKEWRDLPRIVADTPIGKEIAVTIVRNGKELIKTVKVGRLEYADEQTSSSSQNGNAPQAKAVVVDARETAAKHLAPALLIIENQHQPVTAAPRFGKRPIDRFTRVSN